MPTGWIPPEHQHPHAPAGATARSRRRDRRPAQVVLQVDRAGLFVAPVTLRRRLQCLLLGDRLDRTLAEGIEPESDVLLALRAERIACLRSRRQLADAVVRLVRASEEPEHTFTRAPSMAVLERVRAARAELESLAEHLVAPVPVSAHGVAVVRLLLRDGSGPLYRYESRLDLAAQVRRAIEALDPGRDWPS